MPWSTSLSCPTAHLSTLHLVIPRIFASRTPENQRRILFSTPPERHRFTHAQGSTGRPLRKSNTAPRQGAFISCHRTRFNMPRRIVPRAASCRRMARRHPPVGLQGMTSRCCCRRYVMPAGRESARLSANCDSPHGEENDGSANPFGVFASEAARRSAHPRRPPRLLTSRRLTQSTRLSHVS